jgi:DNA-binding NtrC family response regulator
MKILIAEDEPSTLENYRVILETQGHQVVTTNDGESCLQVYKAALPETQGKRNVQPPFDVVMLDVRMPKIEGVQLAKQILSMCPRQRIIMATAYGHEPVIGLVNRLAENVDILQKPFDLETLVGLIKKAGQRLPFL